MINEEQIKRAKELLGLITTTPWEKRTGDEASENLVADVRGVQIFGPYKAVACGLEAEFICLIRNMMPGLIEERERLLEFTISPCSCDPVFSGEEYCNGGCNLREQLAQAQAEVERLRETLDLIANHPSGAYSRDRETYLDNVLQETMKLAKEALNPQPVCSRCGGSGLLYQLSKDFEGSTPCSCSEEVSNDPA